MTGYLDVFVVPVPKGNAAAYRKVAETFHAVWREHGALGAVEVEGDDVPMGTLTSFPRAVALKEDETVFLGVVHYRDRAHRDAVSGKAMKDPRMAAMGPGAMPFDGKRMIFGGFKPFMGTLPQPVLQPYLFFRGRCAEAIEFYKHKLDAEVLMLMRFKDSPEQPPAGMMPPGMDDRVMHASLRIRGSDIMMSDGMRSGSLDFSCMALSLSVPTETEADRVFEALSEGGKVEMPMGKTFFSPRFGSVADKFGVSWMVIVPPPQ
ncbi:MAG: DUF1428 family protein [Hyphomicrobiaceae bacterium]|nr:DUF1428 family protein [Hyphomicrobiaceae bacterium]